MRIVKLVLAFVFASIVMLMLMQPAAHSQSSFDVQGTLSGTGLYNHGSDNPYHLGIRYLPLLRYQTKRVDYSKWEAELSGNFLYQTILPKGESYSYARPYRAYVSYSTPTYDFRLGLQAISFGSASIIRPLMWFERLDARDPLQIAEGVWGGLFRYYFQNNANIWAWMLLGNDLPKGWENEASMRSKPELGGRVQFPIPFGEFALSFHHRKLDLPTASSNDNPKENRLGFDIKMDYVVGAWIEYSWSGQRRFPGALYHQHFINMGCDYTVSLGNGLGVLAEQLLVYQYNNQDLTMNSSTLSLMSLNYKLSLFHQLQSLVYVDWSSKTLYHFWNFSYQYKQLNLFLIFYWNPDLPVVPGHRAEEFFFTGKGVQCMLVYKHASTYRSRNKEVSNLIHRTFGFI